MVRRQGPNVAVRLGLLLGLMLSIYVAPARAGWGLDDYFAITRFDEVATSPDGRWVLYATDQDPVASVPGRKQFWLQGLTGASQPIEVRLPPSAWAFEWEPDSRAFDFIGVVTGGSAIQRYDMQRGEVGEIVKSNAPIVAYKYAGGHRNLAYTVEKVQDDPSRSLFVQMNEGTHGIEIDPRAIGLYDLLKPGVAPHSNVGQRELWIKRGEAAPYPAITTRNVQDFYWDPASRRIAFTFVSEEARSVPQAALVSSIGIYTLASQRLLTVASGHVPVGSGPFLSYGGGVFSSSGKHLLVQRKAFSSVITTSSDSEWAWADAGRPVEEQAAPWRLIGLGLSDRSYATDSAGVVFEATLEGRPGLFRWDGQQIKRIRLAGRAAESEHLVSRSGSGRVSVFVRESLAEPAELFVIHKNATPEQLTHVNESLKTHIDFTYTAVSWPSRDGTTIHGWLLLPKEVRTSLPLLTFVHGGPTWQFTDTFAPYAPSWPYPFETLASRGVAVFFPNFRGTGGFGGAFSTWDRLDGQPVDDILSGIDMLVKQGIAKEGALGLAGQSYGALIGPLVLVRAPTRFRAVSFAEGVTNMITWYRLTSGDTDDMLERTFYGSPDLHLAEYARISPDMHFGGVSTHMLLECGAFSNLVPALGEAKAAQRAGVPVRLYTYPQTGHGLTDRGMRLESSARNLEWFERYLAGEVGERAPTVVR